MAQVGQVKLPPNPGDMEEIIKPTSMKDGWIVDSGGIIKMKGGVWIREFDPSKKLLKSGLPVIGADYMRCLLPLVSPFHAPT